MINIISRVVGIILISAGAVSHSFAGAEEKKGENEIKFRQSGMNFMRWNMGKIDKQVNKHPENYNKQSVVAAANVIAAIANSGIESLFTHSSESGKGWKKTRVKPEFFSEKSKVIEHTDKFKKAAAALVNDAPSGNIDTIRDRFETLLKACKSCHKNYRSKE